MRHIAELESCLKDAVVAIEVPPNIERLRKFPDRAHFLLYHDDAALPVHLEIGYEDSYSQFVNQTVVGRVRGDYITHKGGKINCVLVLKPSPNEVVNARVTCLDSGDFAVVALD